MAERKLEKWFILLLLAYGSACALAHDALETDAPKGEIALSNFSVNCTATVVNDSTSMNDVIQVVCGGKVFSPEKETIEHVGTKRWFQALAGAFICTVCAAMAAGLTLGLASCDEFSLKVLCNTAVEDLGKEHCEKASQKLLNDQRCAAKILPLLSGNYFQSAPRKLNPTNNHLLLVTLLLANASANEALPLFFDRLFPSWLAIIMSVTVVLIFGEIVPSAIFTGPNQIRLAAAFSPLVRVVRMLLLPISMPISLMLDCCLGHAHDEHCRAEMKAMARTLQKEGLENDEVKMIIGVLDMAQVSAEEISKPLAEAKMLAHDDVIDADLIAKLRAWGHSRIFVYERDVLDPAKRDKVIGVLLAKKLIGLDLNAGQRVNSLQQVFRTPPSILPEEDLLSVYRKFQNHRCHLAVVRSPDSGLDAKRGCMFCSLEDVFEAMVKEDIFDETDVELGRCGSFASPKIIGGSSSAVLLAANAVVQGRLQRTATSRQHVWGLVKGRTRTLSDWAADAQESSSDDNSSDTPRRGMC